ncbi:hypothetical protein Tco_0203149 [Tanacetum coccineum]
MAEHSSLSLTKDAAFSSFSLCERRSFKTLALFDGKGRLSDLEVSSSVRLLDVDRGGAGKGFGRIVHVIPYGAGQAYLLSLLLGTSFRA